MHPAIQAFDPAPVVRGLEHMASQGRLAGEEWNWQVQPHAAEQQAAFIFLTCPTVERYGPMRQRFCDSFLHLDVSGYDERRDQLMHCALPKINCWECGDSDEPHYDIVEDDLPTLLQHVPHDAPISTAILMNRQNHFVTCCSFGRRFEVEWRENYDLSDFSKFGQWRAGYLEVEPGRQRHFVPEQWQCNRMHKCELTPMQAGGRKHELILYRDTLRIFREFLGGKPRPPQYQWQDIKDELS
jgi:hypothetical protein